MSVEWMQTILQLTQSHFNVRFLVGDGLKPPGYEIKEGCPAPDIVLIKQFIRWYIRSTEGVGRLSEKKRGTVQTTVACVGGIHSSGKA